MTHGICIPGLSVSAKEMPQVPGVYTLENPEVGTGTRIGRDYTLEEVAEMHATEIAMLGSREELTLCGYSMGGMILAIIAALFRSKLPRRSRFVFLMTSPEPLGSTAPRSRMIDAAGEEEYASALAPYFSEQFLEKYPHRFTAYVRFRMFGLNGQSTQALFRQLLAMQRCRAAEYFARIDGTEATFIGSRADRIFGPKQNAALARLCPAARHVELEGVGHMIHHEQPGIIRRSFTSPPPEARPRSRPLTRDRWSSIRGPQVAYERTSPARGSTDGRGSRRADHGRPLQHHLGRG